MADCRPSKPTSILVQSPTGRQLRAALRKSRLCPPLASPPTKKPDGSRLRGNEKTIARKQALSARALADLDRWMSDHLRVAAAA